MAGASKDAGPIMDRVCLCMRFIGQGGERDEDFKCVVRGKGNVCLTTKKSEVSVTLVEAKQVPLKPFPL